MNMTALLVMALACIVVGIFSAGMQHALREVVPDGWAKWAPRVASGFILVAVWLVVGKVML